MPAPTVTSQTTVLEAARLMGRENIGAVAVVDDKTLQGVFTERDLMMRVVLQKRNPETTAVEEVMTTSVVTVTDSVSLAEALKIMIDKDIRHLPVIGAESKVFGMLSFRHVFRDKVDELTQDLDSLQLYYEADGIGGDA
jgi:CBS domain-containing protein